MAIAVAALTSSAMAQRWQRPDAFNTTMEGRGTAHYNGSTYSFRQIQVTLQKNQRLTVHALLYAQDGRDIVLTGKVSDFSHRTGRLSADLDSVSYGRDFDPADALCDIDTEPDGRFNTVTITGRDTSGHNNLALDFVSNGHQITDLQDPGRNEMTDPGRRDHDQGDDFGGRMDAGRYINVDEWRNHGQHYLLRYTLDLARKSGQARMVVSSDSSVDLPDDRDSKFDHGDVLKYMGRGASVVETGMWSQDGDRVTITFDRIQYGDTNRSKKEVFHGTIRNGVLSVDDYEKSFYGHSATLTFSKQ